MHLKTVILRNFRCFQRLAIDLHPRLTVLVAENGGGKTSILDGIAIGLSPVLRYLSTANQRLSGPGVEDTDFRLESLKGRDGVERWDAADYAQVIVKTDTELTWDHWRGSAKGKQPDQKIGQTQLSSHASLLLESLRTESPGVLPVFAYYGARRGWIEVPKRLRESSVDYSRPTSALAGSLESLSDFKEMLKWYDMEEAAELRADKHDSGKDPVGSSALAAVRSTVDSILGGEYSNPHFDSRHKFVVESKSGELLQVSQLSQGYQSMLALAMDFARRLALANGHLLESGDNSDCNVAEANTAYHSPHDSKRSPPPGPLWSPALMLVDEIDLHLHPAWQQRVLTDLVTAFPGTQFIVASHSPQVLSTVPMESIRIIKEGQMFAGPPGTDGAEAQRILEDVFQVSARANTPMAATLDEYLRLVDNRQWNSPRAIELRRQLDAWSQGQEPRLLEADLQIENLKWEAGQ